MGCCQNNGFIDTGVVCLNGGSCYNTQSDGVVSSACACFNGYSGSTCEISPGSEAFCLIFKKMLYTSHSFPCEKNQQGKDEYYFNQLIE